MANCYIIKVMKKKSAKAGDKLPNKIKCSACGNSKGVRPDVLQKRLADYGTLENLLATYECQKCRKREGSKAPTAPKARSESNAGKDHVHPITGEKVYFWQMPGWAFTKHEPLKPTESAEQYKRAYGTTCANPPFYLDNHRFCDGCVFYNVCACHSKRLKADGGVMVNANGETKKMSYYMRRKLGLIGSSEPVEQKAAVKSGKMSYYMRKKLGLLKWTKGAKANA